MTAGVLPFSITEALLHALTGRGWVTRETLARELRVSVRCIRDTANQSNGAVLAGNSGLRLTCEASQDELEECVGRFRSQVSAMVKRIVETREVWDALHHAT